MNREQRRAMLKNVNKKFTGFDLTDGTLKIPVKVDGEQKDELQLNLNDYNTFSALYNMYLMFTNIEENYKELFDEADNAPTQMDKVKKTMQAYKTIINDFTNAIPAFLTFAMMPLAYSIADGIIFGIISFT